MSKHIHLKSRLLAMVVIEVFLTAFDIKETNMGSASKIEMNATQGESTSDYITLAASFIQKKEGSLIIHAKISNQGGHAIYLFNRLWTLDSSSKLIRDTQSVYRFIDDESLHIFFGIAPLPNFKTVFYQNIPYVTLVKSKSAVEFQVSIPIPVKEYNVYFAEEADSNFECLPLSAVDLMVQYLEADPSIKTQASLVDAEALEILTPINTDMVKTLRSPKMVFPVDVLRRTDDFSRPASPG